MRYKNAFSERLYSAWLPSFCEARGADIVADGFVDRNLEKLNESDAQWFIRALDGGHVVEKAGFFLSERSKAKEQIFWEGSVNDTPRKLSLWQEPIITIGALARLVEVFDWPQAQVGLQSEYPWPFDLAGYDMNGSELLVCEVKKSDAEIDRLIKEMKRYATLPELDVEPVNAAERNAYRKVAGIRRSWPTLFWALGPGGNGQVFSIGRQRGVAMFSLIPEALERLHYSNLPTNAAGYGGEG